MAFPNDNRTILLIGGGLAVVAAVVMGLVFTTGTGKPPQPSPASRGGLNIDLADQAPLEGTRELRCFVDGQYVGMANLADCARRNGLATDALDVGLDATGALAAAPTAAFAPPPAEPPITLSEPTAAATAPAAAAPSIALPAPIQQASGSACLRHTGSEWRTVSSALSLNQCVQALYAGTCVRPGDAQYGRWGEVTLRLVPRRVEQSNDNARFRVLAEQDRSCQFPGMG